MNTNITALQTIVEALEKNDYITNVSPVRKDGEVIGYTITFAHSDTITIYHGEDGVDGYVPNISVMKDVDDIYYWTLDGEWLLDGKGNKVQANGIDGVNGDNGITPRLKIENGYWYVSYDEGVTWIEFGKATGENETNGDNISIAQDDEYVYFNLADGTVITLPKQDAENIQFEDIAVKMVCCKEWDANFDGEISFLEAASVADLGTAFKGNKDIVSFSELRFFTSLTEIPESAFNQCESLWKVTLPTTIKRINSSAFSGCKKLTYINLHDNIKYIYSSVFSSCESLVNIQIPSKVTIIYDATFQGCKSLTSIEIGDSVTEIKDCAFLGCSNLKKITIGDNVTLIGKYICSSCPSLETVVIGKSVTQIGDEAFFGDCNSLKEIYCKALVPPALPYQNITTPPYEDRIPFQRTGFTLYVPEEVYETYCSFISKSSSSSNFHQTNWSLYNGYLQPYDFGD